MKLTISCPSLTSFIGTMKNSGKLSYAVFYLDLWQVWVEIETRNFLLVHLIYVLLYTWVEITKVMSLLQAALI